MNSLVVTILIFLVIGATGLVANLVIGRLVRKDNPSKEKGQIYECGEEPVGTAWIQFDLRFYVVALLFVVFDVEIAFFFPWAVVFGSSVKLGDERVPVEQRIEIAKRLDPTATALPTPAAANAFAHFAFVELLTFFGILLVGFAYLWRRGDLEWVRSVAGQLIPDRPDPEEISHAAA
ncbi:MAG TPA: NADH-quinone oxidoreductase subunit A [Fimbriiglobus sp.]|jgi:NADH-quinone oxidoreductase subunit A